MTGGYMSGNWLELAAPNSTVPLDNYALVLNNQFNYTGGMVYEAENTFTVEFMVKPKVAHEIDGEATSGFSGTEGQKYVMFPVQGGPAEDSRAGMGISVGTNGVSVYEHADGYMPALLVWAYPIDTVWTHVAVVYHNGKPSLYINGVWKKDGLQSLKQHVYPGTQFPGGYYGSQGDGILDEVRIWSVARTEAQIAANKDGELTGPQTGLVGYWPMNEGTGLVLHDVSGSGRDVDLTSAGYTSASWTNGRYSVASIIGSYRYGFNGQEHSTEIGEDDYTAQFWEYDSRIGRRWNIDPVPTVSISSYACFYNGPLQYTDILGNTPDKKDEPAKNGPKLSILGIPIFTGELLYARIHAIDLKYAKSDLPQKAGTIIVKGSIPLLGTIYLMGFQRETNSAERKDNREESENANPGKVGSTKDKTAGHEVAYASTKQGGIYTCREITDEKENRDHGTALKMFYAEHNIKDGEWFIVPLVEQDDKTRTLLTLFRLYISVSNILSKKDNNNQNQLTQAVIIPLNATQVQQEMPARAAAVRQTAPVTAPPRAATAPVPSNNNSGGWINLFKLSTWQGIFFGAGVEQIQLDPKRFGIKQSEEWH